MIITILSFSDNMLTPVQLNKKIEIVLFIIRIFFSSTQHSFNNERQNSSYFTLP